MIKFDICSAAEEEAILNEWSNAASDLERLPIFSETVINVALDNNCIPSLFITRDVEEYKECLTELSRRWPDVPIKQINRTKMCECMGYSSAEGICAIMKIANLTTYEEISKNCNKVLVIDYDESTIEQRYEIINSVRAQSNTQFIAARVSVRTAVALGVDAILFTESSRRYINHEFIRGCMGSLLYVPFAFIPDLDKGGMDLLKQEGYSTFALGLDQTKQDEYEMLSEMEVSKYPRKAYLIQDRQAESEVDHRVFVDFCNTPKTIDIVASNTVFIWEFLK